MFTRVASIVLLVVLLPTASIANDYRDGLEAVQRGAYATARKSFLNSAQRGHAASQKALGILALGATDQAPSHAEALGWLLAAQENGAADLDAHLAKARASGAQASDEIVRSIIDTYGHVAIRKAWLPDFMDPSFNPCKTPGWGRDPNTSVRGAPVPWQHAALVAIERSRSGRLVDLHSVFRFPAGTTRVNEALFLEGLAKRERTHPTQPIDCPALEIMMVHAQGPKSNKQEILVAAASKADSGDAEAQFMVGLALELSDAQGSFDVIKTAAQAGYPEAQYYVSRYLPNPELARKWLELAAQGGVPTAQIELAEAMLASDERVSQLQKIQTLLEGAATSRDEYVLARLAAIRAAAPDEQLRDVRFALSAARALDLKKWPLPIRLEAAALAYAASDDFKAAIRFQKRAIEAAEDMGHDTTRMEERLKTFGANEMWLGYLATDYR